MQLCLRFTPLGLYNRILNSPCLLVLLIHTKQKTIRWNFGLTSRFYSLEGELIHRVDKAITCDYQSGSCCGILGINTRFLPQGLHIRILNSPFLILFTQTNHKTIRWNLGLAPRLYFFEWGELSHWVGKAKNVSLIVGQLPIKARWWDAPIALRDFSWKIKQNIIFSSNTVVTFIVFSKNCSNLLFTCTRRFKNS